ncbi:class II aldolase/adducin family protein [Variovorax sp. AFSI2.2]|uniref:class II aldolase/adducin family protein n=1 Tax=Variovorax sp. AFSI2.2 TaxID=3384160 RepID=UPI003EBC0CAD
MEETEKAARADLVASYKRVVDLGLTELSSGNLSVRFGDGMLISPAGANGSDISVENVVYVSTAGEWRAQLRPSSEWQLHAAIYRDNPETNAVVHTHSDNCVAVACHCKPLPGFHYLVGLFGGEEVPCVPYSTFGSSQLAEDVAGALRTTSACLMSNHGMTARGQDMNEAIKLTHRLEIVCRQYILSRSLGEPRILTKADWEAFFAQINRNKYGA